RESRPVSRAVPHPSLEMEDFFERHHPFVGTPAFERLEEGPHLRLPARVHLALRHPGARGLEIVRLQIAEEEPVFPHEEGIVVPAGLAQRLEHLRPHLPVPPLILLQAIRLHLQDKADPLPSLPFHTLSLREASPRFESTKNTNEHEEGPRKIKRKPGSQERG